MLAKYYPGPGWYVQEGEGDFEEVLSNWMGDHAGCDKNNDTMWGPTHFKLEYEQEGGD